MYENGEGVEKDQKIAVKYYQQAADQGYATAQCNLGFMYSNGCGVKSDKKLAVRYYQLAASQNYPRAQCNLGYMYNNGYGVEKDKKQALKYYQLSAEQGYYVAQYNLGYMYEGKDFENKKLAVKYYILATLQGYENAKKRLREIFKGETENYGHKGYKMIAVEYLASEWPKLHLLVNKQCKEAILELFWLTPYFPCTIPPELICLIGQALIIVWNEPHYDNL